MAEHNETGKKGEEAAVEYLVNMGHEILDRNWYHGKHELDIISEYQDKLVVTEVKTRGGDLDVLPRELVTLPKQKIIVRLADAYARKFGMGMEVQFDVIIVSVYEDGMELEHHEDAFYPMA